MKKKIYLIDGNNFIYRMFFGLPEFTTKDGKIVNAIFGMAKFFVGQLKKENPDYIIFVKDAKGDNFRHELYPDYKATRDRMPDNLRVQISDIEEMIKMMGVDIVEISGYEADDVIGTLAKKYSGNMDYEIDILTGDKDLYSLVSENVNIYDTMKRKKFGPEETKEKFGIEPGMIIDYLAIMGDKADNIPGIDGFGPKKAVTLINDIGSVEKVYEVLDSKKYDALTIDAQKLFAGKSVEKLIASRENAFLSKKLATIKLHVELEGFDLNNFVFHPEKLLNEKSIDFFQKCEFYSLIGETYSKKKSTWKDIGLSVIIIDSDTAIISLKNTISDYNEVILDTETTSIDIMEAKLVGISIYLDDNNIYYINRGHEGNSVSDTSLYNFLDYLFDSEKTIVGHNIKYDLEILDMFRKNSNPQSGKKQGVNNGQMSLII